MVNSIQVKLKIIVLQRDLRTAEEVRQGGQVPATKHPSQ